MGFLTARAGAEGSGSLTWGLHPWGRQLVCWLSQVFVCLAPEGPVWDVDLPHTRLGTTLVSGVNPSLLQHSRSQHRSPHSPCFPHPLP